MNQNKQYPQMAVSAPGQIIESPPTGSRPNRLCDVAARETQITHEYKLLRVALEALSETVSRLRNRFAPVLSGEERPLAAPENSPRQNICGLAEGIRDSQELANSVQQRIQQIIGDCEL